MTTEGDNGGPGDSSRCRSGVMCQTEYRPIKTNVSVTLIIIGRTPLLLDLQNRHGNRRLALKIIGIAERTDPPSDMHGNRHLR
jgi:hypothetical protein